MDYLGIVTVLALFEYLALSILVGRARVTYGIKAPATSGHEIFERFFRVHQNTLEQLVDLPARPLGLRHAREPQMGRDSGTDLHRRPRGLRPGLPRESGAAGDRLPDRLRRERHPADRRPGRRDLRHLSQVESASTEPLRADELERACDPRASRADARAQLARALVASDQGGDESGGLALQRQRLDRASGQPARAGLDAAADSRSRRAASRGVRPRSAARSIAGTVGSALPVICSPRSSSAPAGQELDVHHAAAAGLQRGLLRVLDAALARPRACAGPRRTARGSVRLRARSARASRRASRCARSTSPATARERSSARCSQVRGLLDLVAREGLVRGDERRPAVRRGAAASPRRRRSPRRSSSSDS